MVTVVINKNNTGKEIQCPVGLINIWHGVINKIFIIFIRHFSQPDLVYHPTYK